MMINKLREYVTGLFLDVPRTRKVMDFQDELLANSIEKYNDLLVQGKTEEQAYNSVVSGIGDIGEILQTLDEGNVLNWHQDAKERKKSAKFIAVAVGLYILSPIPLFLSDVLFPQTRQLGLLFLFLFVAVATGLLVYNNISRPKYLKMDDTLVEEFKEWKSKKSGKKTLRDTISSVMWLMIIVVYFLVSFSYGIWAYSWIIFIIGAAIDQIIKAVFDAKEK